MHSSVFLVMGLSIGAAGAILFNQSMPPQKGSPEERIAKLEVELKRSTNRVMALEGADPTSKSRTGRTMKDGLRKIAEDIREGRPVTPDDLLEASQPLLRDLSPLFERIRTKELQRQSDSKAGEYARKYALNPAQQEALKQWLLQDAATQAKAYTDLLTQKGTKLEDLAKSATEVRIDDGLDDFMEGTLKGEKLTTYRSDRMLEKVANVQKEADMKVERLDSIVKLDEAQRGQVFGIMARGANDYEPTMQFEGLDTTTPVTGKSKQDAILSILRPEQRQAYEDDKEKRRISSKKELEGIGLTLPDDWSDQDHFD
jgi:hypothetical protein